MSLESDGQSEFIKKMDELAQERKTVPKYFRDKIELQGELNKYGITYNDAQIIGSRETFISYINEEGNLRTRKICLMGLRYVTSDDILFIQDNLPIRRSGKIQIK
jgi:hypothetical protein